MNGRAAAPVWLFDLDNTLHNTNVHIFPHINRAMTEYIATHLHLPDEEADRLRNDYWKRYGATLLGMMRLHNTDPSDFLRHTHDVAKLSSMVVFERALRGMLRRLPGRKVVCSNGPRAYVDRILQVMRVSGSFDKVFGIEDFLLHPKPQRKAFLAVLRRLRVPAHRCVLVEDSLENLRTAKCLGMKTVWVHIEPGRPSYVDLKLRSVLQLPRAMNSLF